MIQRILVQTKCRDVIKIDESRYFWVVQHPPNGQCSLSLHEKQLFKSRDSTRLSLVPDAYRSNKLHSTGTVRSVELINNYHRPSPGSLFSFDDRKELSKASQLTLP